jgi:NAD(P)-dependent dehydrogenase (short-subunit alcohol dehydrogenase family)
MATMSIDGGPALDGRVAIITGATGGLGFETALGLARRGATTILAARNPAKGEAAEARIRQDVPSARARFEMLDLASLASVAGFASRIAAAHGGVIDILVNNGAVMGLPEREVTKDGFERQIGVNYLAHFALTLRLLDALRAAPGGGRVVNVASLAHRRATLGLDDFQSERSYRPMRVYGRSKLAMLVFALELQRRADRNYWNLRSVAAHPGWARTGIIPNGIGAGAPGLKARLVEAAFGLVAQSAADGALPLLFAATAAEAKGGAYYGPSGWGETRGAPGLSHIFPQAADRVAGSRLWALSARLTGVAAAQEAALPAAEAGSEGRRS